MTTDVSELYINIAVDDSGPGLRSDDHKSDSRKPFGLGLGLTICREIAAQHGGELFSESSSMLGGARFTLRLRLRILNRTETPS